MIPLRAIMEAVIYSWQKLRNDPHMHHSIYFVYMIICLYYIYHSVDCTVIDCTKCEKNIFLYDEIYFS